MVNKKKLAKETEKEVFGKDTRKQEDVDMENLRIEIREILEPCIKCGMCKSICPVFQELKEEYFSPRGRTILLQDEVLDKIIFKCNLCKACEKRCPLKVKVWEATRKARELMVLKGKELSENKEMIKNIRETGNPFGANPDEKGKLYCC